MNLETNRLVLRPWNNEDAIGLFEYAKDPAVGPAAGWPVHTSVENSKEIIQTILSAESTFAITLKGSDRAIGSVGLMIGTKSNLDIGEDEAEVGFWLAQPFWGQGIVPEAVSELQRYAFQDLHLNTLWCAYFDGNEKSKRAQEKCHFLYHHTEKENIWAALNELKTEHVSCLTKIQWSAL